MPDSPVTGRDDGNCDPPMGERISHAAEDIRDMKSLFHKLEAATNELRETTSRLEHVAIRREATLDATLPHFATMTEVTELRADMLAGLADEPGEASMWGILAVLLNGYACGVAGVAVLK